MDSKHFGKYLLPAAVALMSAATLSAQTTRRISRATPGARPQAATATPAAATTNNTAAVSTTDVAQQLAKAERGKGGRPKLKFDNAPSELFLQLWSQVTGRTLLTSPDVPKVTMSLRSNGEENWTDEEYLQAIEQQLQLNGIGIMPVGEHFALVVPFKTIGQQGIETHLEVPLAGRHPELGQIIRQVITPKNISAEEAQAAIETFKRPDGTIQYLERTNSLLITDTQENVNRMLEIINFIDRPMPVLEEVHVCPIKYAKAEDVKKALEEFVQASREEESSKSKKSTAAPQLGNSLSQGMQPGSSRRRSLPGVTRPQVEEAAPQTNAALDALVSDADRGMIRGKAQIMADVRSNQLIIVTRPSNMEFFKRIIEVLDIETAPEIAVEIIRLKYAKADTEDSEKGVADLLNELIDNASTKKDDKDNTVNNSNSAEGINLTEKRDLSRQAQQVADNMNSTTKSKMGELRKENIKILADKRINAVMVMASPGDLAAIKEIIATMDIPVSQVLIETVVLSVGLTDQISTGVQWVKRVDDSNNYRDSFGGGGAGTLSPQNLFGTASSSSSSSSGSTSGGSSDTDAGKTPSIVAETAGELVGSAVGMTSGGTSYFGTVKGWNLDFLLHAAESDSHTKVLTSPILMTQDNKEAVIESTELVYLYNGMKYMGSSYSGSDYQPDIKQEEMGLKITVTPRINPDGTVVLEFEETFQQLGTKKIIPGSGTDGKDGSWDSPVTRKISGSISVANGQTVVIGGLVTHTKTTEESGIPILKNIPYIGKYLFGYTSDKDERNELLVFLTPYVFEDSKAAQDEAQRRKDYLDAAGVWNKGWSRSELADATDEEDMYRREKAKNKYELKQLEAKQKRVKQQIQHEEKVEELEEMNEKAINEAYEESNARTSTKVKNDLKKVQTASREKIQKDLEHNEKMERILRLNLKQDREDLAKDRATLTEKQRKLRENGIAEAERVHAALLKEIEQNKAQLAEMVE